ncbi:MAG: hypothetical protein ACH37Z_14635 [Anaerolineae bacterium]
MTTETLGPCSYTDKASHVRIAATDVPVQETLVFEDSVTIAAGGTVKTPTLAPYKRIAFKVSGLTSETVNVTGYLNTSETIATAKLRPIDLNTGALAASSDLGNGSYALDNLSVESLVFDTSASTETPVVTYRAKGA